MRKSFKNRRFSAFIAGPAVLVLWFTAGLSAQDGISYPEGTRSVRVVGGAASVRATTDLDGPVRGAIRFNTRHPVLETAGRSGGCPGWTRIDEESWVCNTMLEPSTEEPAGRIEPWIPRGRTVPYRYARVRRGGTDAFSRPDGTSRSRRLASGFVVALRPHRNPEGAVPMARTLSGDFVREDAIDRLYPSRFEGIEITEDTDLSTLGWVSRFREPMYGIPRVSRRTGRARYLRIVTVMGEENGFYQLEDGNYIDAEAVSRPSPTTEFPEGIGDDEHWIDVHLDSQTLMAYEGTRPVFVTLISSGRPYRGRETPTGEFRIWAKLATATMDDIGNADASEDYSVQGVPWVQYFEGSVGFHAAFWHAAFGTRVSHGCINLSPIDARWLFGFTEPVLRPGWVSIRPSELDPGTLVRVR
ncbi:MAG: L,D-transpeptidase [Myxococcota bacterium]